MNATAAGATAGLAARPAAQHRVMRIAFYAPLKPPDHPVPSGERRMAQLLIEALRRAGHQVELASRLRSREPAGDPARQARLARVGAACARRLLRRYGARPAGERPQLWFTYHLYYKAPDWIGPQVAKALAIPYVVAEASLAPKRAGGPWDASHRAVEAALRQAALVIALNPADLACLPEPAKTRQLAPFIAAGPFRSAAADRARHRARLAARHGLDPAQPWLIAVAMMREGDKLASYRLLAGALGRLTGRHWQLLIVGDGPARPAVERAFAGLTPRVRFTGLLAADALAPHLAASDILVWPAVREAFGLALLEAQAAGLPVVAGASGGVPAVVRDGETGLLAPEGDAERFASAVAALLDDPRRRRVMAATAAERAARAHDIEAAAQRLDGLLQPLVSPA